MKTIIKIQQLLRTGSEIDRKLAIQLLFGQGIIPEGTKTLLSGETDYTIYFELCCNQNSFSIDLSVKDNRLEEIPKEWELEKVQHLTRLDLSFNQLRPRSIDQISQLSCLEVLDLSENLDLCSGKNLNQFSKLPKLQELHLDYCNFEFMPFDFSELSELRELSMQGTNLKEIPKSIGKAKNLRSLNLSRSYQLKTISPAIHKLQKLYLRVDAGHNFEKTDLMPKERLEQLVYHLKKNGGNCYY